MEKATEILTAALGYVKTGWIKGRWAFDPEGLRDYGIDSVHLAPEHAVVCLDGGLLRAAIQFLPGVVFLDPHGVSRTRESTPQIEYLRSKVREAIVHLFPARTLDLLEGDLSDSELEYFAQGVLDKQALAPRIHVPAFNDHGATTKEDVQLVLVKAIELVEEEAAIADFVNGLSNELPDPVPAA